jgi:hypothetical protein
MVLSTEVIIEGLLSQQYHCFVPQVDHELSSTPSEQEDTTKTFWELLTGYGINDQGAEENEFFKLVHFILHRNKLFHSEGLPLLFVPFIVVEQKLYTGLRKKAGSMETWLDYAADDRTFFSAAKSYAKHCGKETVFVFVLFSKPYTRRHAYVCFVRIDETGSFLPTEEDHKSHPRMKPFMMICDDTGDEHKSTNSVKHIIPWGDDDLDVDNQGRPSRPKARHNPKLECDKSTGSSCDVQLALETIQWSTNCCLIYVLTLLLSLLNSPSQEVQNFGTAPYTSFHRWFTDVLAVRVKSITKRYLEVFALLPSSTEPLYAVKIDHQNVDISKKKVSASQVNAFKSQSGKVVVQAEVGKKAKTVTRFVNDEKKFANQGLYILGYGEDGKANLELLNAPFTMEDTEAASSIFWNVLGEVEDCPGKKINVKLDCPGMIIEEGEGNDKACVELPDLGKFSREYKKTVDNELFRAAIKAKVTVKIVAYMASPHSYRVLLSILSHPLFICEVDSDQIQPIHLEEFWATLKVPDSMRRHPWTFCPPEAFSQQLMGDFSCMQRSLAALLGHEDALCSVWLEKLDLMISWRDMGRTECKGATYTDMIKPGKAAWIKTGAVSEVTIKYLLHELSPLKLEQVTKNARDVTTFLSQKFAVTAPGEMPSIGLVCGWPQSAFKGRAKKAKNKNEFKQKEEEDVYSFQRIAGDSTRVHVTWAPSKKRTKEPIINVEHLITESSKRVFESGAEVVLEDDSDLELTAEQAAQNKQRCIDAKKDAKSGKHKREVLSRMKMKDASYTMHIIPAYFDTNLCRDPMIKTQDGETWAAGGTDLQEGIWKVLQKNKDSTKVYRLLQKDSMAAPQRFRDPGPRLVTSSTASFSSSSSSSGSGLERFQDLGPRLVSSGTASSSSSSSSSDESAQLPNDKLLNFQLDMFEQSAQLPFVHNKQVAALHTMSLLREKERDATLPVPVSPAKRARPAKRACPARPEADAIPLRQLRSRK